MIPATVVLPALTWRALPLRALLTLLIAVLAYAYLLRFERQTVARLALGGNKRWGPLWPLADMVRALAKADILPVRAHRAAVFGGAVLTVLPEVIALALVPATQTPVYVATRWYDASLNPSLATVFILEWCSLFGVLLVAWGTGTAPMKRRARELVRSFLAFSLPALIGLGALVAVSRVWSLADLVKGQARGVPYLVYQPLGALVTTISLVLSGDRLPFRQSDEANRLEIDFHLQHGGTVPALLHLAEYLHILLVAAVLATSYLAGYVGPWLPAGAWLAIKAIGIALAMIWLRARCYARWHGIGDRRMWVGLMGLAGINLLVTLGALAWRG